MRRTGRGEPRARRAARTGERERGSISMGMVGQWVRRRGWSLRWSVGYGVSGGGGGGGTEGRGGWEREGEGGCVESEIEGALMDGGVKRANEG